MSRQGVVAAVLAAGTALVVAGAATPAAADDGGTVSVGGSNSGIIDTAIVVPGSAGAAGPVVQPVGGGSPDGSPVVTCTYSLEADPVTQGDGGNYYLKKCTDGTVDYVWVPTGSAPAPAGAGAVTPAQLAAEARDRLVLTHPMVHRSPDETLTFKGDQFTYVRLWTWFWTNPADYRPLTHTLSVGGVSATVTAKPVGLLFDPGDGNPAVQCAGPGRAWSERDANQPPPAGACAYRYERATDAPLPARMGILWRVSWTGSGGTGGTLPTMETLTRSPLRVLQIQTVTR